jgi:hypothetical protein
MRALIEKDLHQHFSADIEVKNSFLGGNSIVHQIKVGDLNLAVKEYKGEVERKIRSLQREKSALHFLNQNEVPFVPEIIYSQEELGFIVTEFILGDKPKPNRQSIKAILEFTKKLHELFQVDSTFPFAVDAGIKPEDIQSQISERISQVRTEFISYMPRIKTLSMSLNMRFLDVFSENKLTYSVSDLGLHNALLFRDEIFFIDLEFFGKDSPYKLIGDFLLHPQNRFSRIDNAYFLDEGMSIFDMNKNYLKDYVGLLAVKWSLICIKRLQNLSREGADFNVLQAQKDLVGYYLDMAELFVHSGEWEQLLNKERFSS